MNLKTKNFKSSIELCDWINLSESRLTVISICNNEFMEFVLFYTEIKPELDSKKFNPDKFWTDRNKRSE